MNRAVHRLLVAVVTFWVFVSMGLVISAPTHGHLTSMVFSVVAMVIAPKLGDDPPATFI